VPKNLAYGNASYPGDALTTDANGNALNGTVGPMGVPSPTTLPWHPRVPGFAPNVRNSIYWN
jgi:hypothetical protein